MKLEVILQLSRDVFCIILWRKSEWWKQKLYICHHQLLCVYTLHTVVLAESHPSSNSLLLIATCNLSCTIWPSSAFSAPSCCNNPADVGINKPASHNVTGPRPAFVPDERRKWCSSCWAKFSLTATIRSPGDDHIMSLFRFDRGSHKILLILLLFTDFKVCLCALFQE